MYKVLGIANPFLDYILHVSEEYLSQLTKIKGGMEPIDHEDFCRIIENSRAIPKIIAGGSGTNTIKALSKLGHSCALAGKIGKDPPAKQFLESIALHGINPLYQPCETPTGKVICFVTPDGERTMRSYLGASMKLKPRDLEPKFFQNVELVHIEGYTILNNDVAFRAMSLAKKAGAKVSYDLANFEVVYEKKEELIPLISSYVDILFANENELLALTGLNPEQGCEMLKGICEMAVILRGKNGCLVGSGQHQFAYSAYVVEAPLDTTGAGDLFAGGFLHGYLSGKSLEECARLGSLVASIVVQVDGAEIPAEMWRDILL